MKTQHLLLSFILLCGLLQTVEAQKTNQNTIYNDGFLLTPNLAFHLPGGDLKQRFGPAFSFGMETSYKFGKNWQIGADGRFIFGRKVKENNILNNYLIPGGLIFNNTGEPDEIGLSMRGASIQVFGGKTIPFSNRRPESGLLLRFGGGYFQHKILIDVNRNTVPQLSDDYKTGYDRLSSGFIMTQFIGLMKLEKEKYVNVYFGIEISEAFTKGRRPWDFATNQALHDTRFELLFSLKFGWIIPVFVGQTTEDEYYY